MHRVLAIFLDGYEHSLGQQLMAAGEMPAMARLAASSARFALDYGPAQRTGLAGEHIATGLAPDDARRWSAVHFDPQTYQVWQEGTRLTPLPASLDARTVVFDTPYFDLKAAPAVNGIVGWGAHDPGVAPDARPADVTMEMRRRFGSYPAQQWIYGFSWPSAHRTRDMGEDLARAVDVRTDAAHWLLAERLPDWDLALVTVSESHSVIEALWHGVDPAHPLHHLPSAGAARAGIHGVYRAIDRLIGRLTSAFPDARTVVFAMGGMGDNRSDLPSMVMLPELMYRRAFKERLFTQPQQWRWSDNRSPVILSETDTWSDRIQEGFRAPPQSALRKKSGDAGTRIEKALSRLGSASPQMQTAPRADAMGLEWMPAAAYRPFWHAMPVFALPSYYDGRIRVNLKGRESRGMVEPGDHRRLLEKVERLVREAVDPVTGESAVDFVEYTAPSDPRDLSETEADMVIVWKGNFSSLEHPSLGRIGPLPYRRTGGHTGVSGMAYVRGGDLPAGEYGTRSAFDVVPTLIALLEHPRVGPLSGASLLAAAERTTSKDS